MAINQANIPLMSQPNGAPITSPGSGTGAIPGVNYQNQSTDNTAAGALLGGLTGLALSKAFSSPTTATKTPTAPSVTAPKINPITPNKPSAPGTTGIGTPSGTPIGGGATGSVGGLAFPKGTTQAQVDAYYGKSNGQSNYVIAGTNMSNGDIIAQPSTSIGGSNLTGTGSGPANTATPPADQTPGTYFQDPTGNIYDGDGNLYAVKSGDTYYVKDSSATDTWINANNPKDTISTNELYSSTGGGFDPSTIDTEIPAIDTGSNDYTGGGYDPNSYYTPPTDTTNYYPDYGYTSGPSTDTSVYSPIDTTGGMFSSWFKKGGLATPLFKNGGEVRHMADGGILDTVGNVLTNPVTVGALAGGALGNLSGGSNNAVSTGIDMTKLGINPRTTTFGMGPSKYMPYENYSQPYALTTAPNTGGLGGATYQPTIPNLPAMSNPTTPPPQPPTSPSTIGGMTNEQLTAFVNSILGSGGNTGTTTGGTTTGGTTTGGTTTGGLPTTGGTTGTSTAPKYYTDGKGNIYDASGNLVQAATPTTPTTPTTGGTTTGGTTTGTTGGLPATGTTPVYYQDTGGNIYDANGNLVKTATTSTGTTTGGTTTGTTTPTTPAISPTQSLINAFGTEMQKLQAQYVAAPTAQKAGIASQITELQSLINKTVGSLPSTSTTGSTTTAPAGLTGSKLKQYNNLQAKIAKTTNPFIKAMLERQLSRYGTPVSARNMLNGGLAFAKGGLTHDMHPDNIVDHVPIENGRHDYRAGARVEGAGDGQSDDIPAMLADGEYVIDAETVAQLGNGSNKAGAKVLDSFRENIRAHKRNAPLNQIPPKSKSPLAYLKGVK